MKEKKNIPKTVFIIFAVSLLTYAVMAVITHFSLNFKIPGYKFADSIKSIIDFKTDIFKFYVGFMMINVVWISGAVLIFYVKKFFQKKI